ncbi:MAG: nucleoside triphosphate pyrophosphohydrolase [Verrucomicrobia bacterium]|nr:nucleoside triphosphate pyrophosphohydrolase [Verrucomicrobiota bacterium]
MVQNKEPGQNPMERLLGLMRTLRSEKGCPWDREQTLQSLKPYLLEECYEALDALNSGDRARLCDELGDVLLQIVFQSQIASEEGSFCFDDVATAISDKLVRRHPHVFGEVKVSGSAEVTRNWEAIKKVEKGEPRKSAVDGVPRSAPALHKAQQIQKRAARVGFDWDTVHQVVDKVEEEVGEVKEAMASGDPKKIKEEIGDLLFAAVNLSRFLGHNAEEALDETIEKFTRRFQGIEQRLHAQGRTMSDCKLAELDAIWNEIKAAE